MDNERIKTLEKENSLLKANESFYKALDKVSVSKHGKDYFDIIASMLSDLLGCDCVIIGQIINGYKIRAVVQTANSIKHDYVYSIKGTPSEKIIDTGECYFSDKIAQKFSDDPYIHDVGAKSYFGTALYNDEKEIIGVLSVLSKSEMSLSIEARNMVATIASRISAEIERRNIINEVKISRSKIKKANSLKNKLISILSHDLKNSFNNIVLLSDAMTMDLEADNYSDIKSQVKLISESALQSTDLLNNLLNWSISQMDGNEFVQENAHLEDICDAVFQSVESLAREKKITLSSEVSRELISFVDQKMIETVIRNLVVNAIKYTDENGKIIITAAEQKDYIQVSINDNGIGIDKETISAIFDIDTVISTPGTNNEQGTGLGLMLCSDFVEMHNGKIWVESEPGVGSSFKFTVPSKNNS